jgi:hypothetical protein
MKTIQPGQIDWTGFKSVLMHTLIGAGLAAVLEIIHYFTNINFGVYSSIATPAIVFITAFVKKLAETYSVVVPNTPVSPNADTGSVTPDTTLNE